MSTALQIADTPVTAAPRLRPAVTGLRSDERHTAFPTSVPTHREWTLYADDDLAVTVTVSVVIPTLNEALNLPYILPQIPEGVGEVIIVDGHSTDGTVEVAKSLRPDVVVVDQPGKGKGDALRAGFDAATGDIIVMLDADGSMSPREISYYVEALANGADVATGSRMMEGGGSADFTPLRKWGNDGLRLAFKWLYGLDQTDLCYGYMGFWKRAVERMELDCDGFEVETLINTRSVKVGLRMVEVPSIEARRLYGDSNLRTFRDGFRVLRTLLTEWRTTRHAQRV